MKPIILLLLFVFVASGIRAQSGALGYLNQFPDSVIRVMAEYFDEIDSNCQTPAAQLWGRPLYGPVLLVDPESRKVYANRPDPKGVLARYGTVYAGFLPREVLLANTATEFAGLEWTMVLLPLPPGRHGRLDLVSHELFHRIQDSLGLPAKSPSCTHLDSHEGRLYFRLELAALKAALLRPVGERKEDLRNALRFREWRYRMVGDTTARAHEQELEFNEGLAEFTGVEASGITRVVPGYLVMIIDSSVRYPSFTRSFAYITGPVYGELLSQRDSGWQRHISLEDNFPELVRKYYGLSSVDKSNGMRDGRSTIAREVARVGAAYGYDRIATEEQAREDKRLAMEEQYRKLLVDGPVLRIPLVNMHFSFNPNNLFSLGDSGTVYPGMTVTDDWGRLEVGEGGVALMDKKWKNLHVGIGAAGWKLELKPGWKRAPDLRNGDFVVVKE